MSLSVRIFLQTDGAQSAGAFAYYAFFSLFPLIILFVTIASLFIDRGRAGIEVVAYVETYIPISGEMQSYIFDTITGVINTRKQASVTAFLMLIWSAMQFFNTLICATNRAWGVELSNWWRSPLKSLFFLAIMVCVVLFGVAMPVIAAMTKEWLWLFPFSAFSTWLHALLLYFIPSSVVFVSISLLYRLAPNKPTRFTEVWRAAVCATVLMQLAEKLFVIYLRDFAALNAIYGAFGGIMALLTWIYLSGSIFIFGACLCAAYAQEK